MEWEVNVFYIFVCRLLTFQWIDRLVYYCRPEIHSLDRVVTFLQVPDLLLTAEVRLSDGLLDRSGFTWPIGVYLTDRGFNLSFEFEFWVFFLRFQFTWLFLAFCPDRVDRSYLTHSTIIIAHSIRIQFKWNFFGNFLNDKNHTYSKRNFKIWCFEKVLLCPGLLTTVLGWNNRNWSTLDDVKYFRNNQNSFYL